MLIRHFTPELHVTDCPTGTHADLEDVVVSVQNQGECRMAVRLRKSGKYAPEYTITLRIPEYAFQKTLLAIIRKNGMTLGEIGELDV
jgi:hypothetical protein